MNAKIETNKLQTITPKIKVFVDSLSALDRHGFRWAVINKLKIDEKRYRNVLNGMSSFKPIEQEVIVQIAAEVAKKEIPADVLF